MAERDCRGAALVMDIVSLSRAVFNRGVLHRLRIYLSVFNRLQLFDVSVFGRGELDQREYCVRVFIRGKLFDVSVFNRGQLNQREFFGVFNRFVPGFRAAWQGQWLAVRLSATAVALRWSWTSSRCSRAVFNRGERRRRGFYVSVFNRWRLFDVSVFGQGELNQRGFFVSQCLHPLEARRPG